MESTYILLTSYTHTHTHTQKHTNKVKELRETETETADLAFDAPFNLPSFSLDWIEFQGFKTRSFKECWNL